MATYQVTVEGFALEQQIRNVFHVVHAGSATPDELAGSFRNAWITNIMPQIHVAYGLEGVRVENIADDSAVGYAAPTVAVTGQQGGQPMPSVLCASVQLRSARRGRAGTGRTGVGPLAEGQVDGQTLIPTAAADIEAAFNALIEDITASGGAAAMNLAVVSKVLNKQPRPAPLVSLITSASVPRTVGTRLSRHPNR